LIATLEMRTHYRNSRRDSRVDIDVAEWPPSDAKIKLYERALDRDPRNHFLLLDLAGEYGQHRRELDVRRTLERVAELFPASAMMHARVASAYAKAHLPQQAIEHYRRSLEIDPQQAAAGDIMLEISSLYERGLRPVSRVVSN
jgi:tetratricopeptide (TPR) repeat protein